MPAPTQAALAKPGAVSQSGVSDVSVSPYRTSQMIIKNGEMNLLVADVDVALDRATAIAVELGGYLLNGKSWMQDGWKYSSLTVGVPVDQFETAQRRMRALAVQVLNDTASGQDVSTEFVDVQSRVTNLEATAARIREFLKQAKDVPEALTVNAKLAEVEAEIEQAKGRMNYPERPRGLLDAHRQPGAAASHPNADPDPDDDSHAECHRPPRRTCGGPIGRSTRPPMC